MATSAPLPSKGNASPAKAESPAKPELKNTPAKPQTETETKTAPVELEHHAIASLAYSYWLDRDGSDEVSADEDWLRAEQELRQKHSR